MKIKHNKFSGFTLVELIVVITILVILSTIAFISLQGLASNARDSVRISDITNAKKSLAAYMAQASEYPLPDNRIGTGVINGQILTYAGEIGVNNSRILKLNKHIQDPLTNTNYLYGITRDQREYQIATIIEGNLVSYKPFIETVHADISSAKVDGNYQGYIKYNSGSEAFIANIPSLIFNNTNSTVELLSTGTYYIVDKKQNLPYDERGGRTNTGIIQKIHADSLIKEMTRNPTSTLTGINITNITKDNFETVFTGDTLKSFNVSGMDVTNMSALMVSIKSNILGNDGGIGGNKGKDISGLVGGDFSINNGATTTVTSNAILNITCPMTASMPVRMFLSGTGLATGGGIWENCVNNKNITLTSGEGIKNINIKWKDNIGNETGGLSKTINYIILGTYSGCDNQDILVGNYIISACNVGSTKSSEYNLCKDATTCTTPRIGNLFQWGNNGPLSYSTATTTSQINASTYGPGKYYSNSIFVKGFSDWSTVTNNNLWGGENVTLENINNTAKEGMKGPCESGYYIPTTEQWKEIVFNITGKKTGLILSDIQKVQDTLKIPLGGNRGWYNGAIGLPGQMNYFWASNGGPNNDYPSGGGVFIIYYDPPTINIDLTMAKGNAFFVRCIKK